jgi:uncharacterized protein YcnI
MKFQLISTLFVFTALTLGTVSASAHVVVKPALSTPSAYETFNISVPNEKEQPVTKLKLIIPTGLLNPRPTQKVGWNINLVKDEKGDVKEIEWSGGQIAKDLRDDFTFSAKTPATEVSLPWKAYQTFGDGSETAWIEEPKNASDPKFNPSNPYSVTKIEVKKEVKETKPETITKDENNLPLYISLVALLISIGTGFIKLRKS